MPGRRGYFESVPLQLGLEVEEPPTRVAGSLRVPTDVITCWRMETAVALTVRFDSPTLRLRPPDELLDVVLTTHHAPSLAVTQGFTRDECVTRYFNSEWWSDTDSHYHAVEVAPRPGTAVLRTITQVLRRPLAPAGPPTLRRSVFGQSRSDGHGRRRGAAAHCGRLEPSTCSGPVRKVHGYGSSPYGRCSRLTGCRTSLGRAKLTPRRPPHRADGPGNPCPARPARPRSGPRRSAGPGAACPGRTRPDTAATGRAGPRAGDGRPAGGR